ncbi:hypothetical protein ASPVEDRAFT_40392 [Aspergillus versicolor CBS 583.65]|uniref:Uncharacterized protein n=1 Tax=Aspergillus versicolor CBS 583.65 TaxID=1036611 RepID=A0A1L9PHA6_ASPVE|nr:uncharacterized protein ASPVEDRAFT_40392 [Aspergillus versicolor CBS 583.65]OJJ00888.1 hypothetical protein ASPVEDRAFT_40392 [Aspergillus versicolor CBS 583.65]
MTSQPDENNIPSCFTDTHGVITVTTNDVPGYIITKPLGTVYGLTVRARNWGADLGAIVRSAIGGELRPFTTLMYRARNEAVERLVGECMGRGGNAVVAMRFDIASFGACVQVCAYGTACFVEREGEGECKVKVASGGDSGSIPNRI